MSLLLKELPTFSIFWVASLSLSLNLPREAFRDGTAPFSCASRDADPPATASKNREKGQGRKRGESMRDAQVATEAAGCLRFLHVVIYLLEILLQWRI